MSAEQTSAAEARSLSRLQAFYLGLSPDMLLRAAIYQEFPGKIALLSSFGADSALLLAMVAEINPAIPVLFLETDKHFPETLDYVETLRELLGLTNIIFLKPRDEMLARIDGDGTLWQHQPNRCCWLRKVEPLKRGLEEGGYHALITGRKRYQTEHRSQMDAIEMGEDGVFRINPLSEFGREEITAGMQRRGLPQHPLVAKGYRSIGCAPCTMPVTEGQDDRAGRWQHTGAFPGAQKSECGIHVPAAAEALPGWEI